MALLFYADFDTSLNSDYPVVTAEYLGDIIQSANATCGSKSAAVQSTAGGNGYLRYPSAVTLGQQGTMSFYTYISSAVGFIANANVQVSKSSSNLYGVQANFLYLSGASGTYRFRFYDNVDNIIASKTASMPIDTWTHMEMSWNYDTGDIATFINGVRSAQSITPDTMRTGSSYVRIKQFWDDDYFYVDNLAIFDTVLHTSNFTPTCYVMPPSYLPGLTFGYPLGMRGFTR